MSVKSIKPTKAWKAHLQLCFERIADKTVLASRSQIGPLTVQQPFYPEQSVCHLYLLHPPGGVVGGDQLNISLEAKESANTLITTPGATKFYLSTGLMAQQTQTLVVRGCSSLEWLPQENIFFDGARATLSSKVKLEKDAVFIGWEVNCFGRPVAKKAFKQGVINTVIEIERDGIPILLDKLTVTDSSLKSPSCLNGYTCFGTFIATQITTELLEMARGSLDAVETKNLQIGLTLLDDILVVRCLGQYAEQVREPLIQIWKILRPEILGKQACLPRIWST